MSAAVWSPGDEILIRHVRGGRVLFAVPQRVVEHRPDALVTWVAPATQHAYPVGRGEDGALMELDRWTVELRAWYGNGNLDLTPAGRAHMIRHFWHDDASFRGWYVNLQEPLRATERGFDTDDQQLDLWIEPGRRVEWKDEDDLERAAELGMLAVPAEAVRGEAQHVLEEWPLPTGWEGWRPDPAWPAPRLPRDWDVLD